jgi:hypothetical protein
MKRILEIDLHGYTAHDGWKKFRNETLNAYLSGKKSLIVVTGHGMMAREFKGWCDADPYVIGCTNMNPNTGAWKVNIKKSSIKVEKQKVPDTALDLKQLYKKFNSR